MLKDTGKLPQALAQYKKVRETYADTPQAEQSAFWVAQLSFQTNDNKAALLEYKSFMDKFPKSELFPTAKFGLAQATFNNKDSATAMKLYKEIADDYPKSMPAPFTFFQRAAIYAADQKAEEMVALMREFIQKYPEDDKIYYAYESVCQSLIGANKAQDAVVLYAEFVEKHGKDPHAPAALLMLSQLWRQYAVAKGRYLALNAEDRAEWSKGIKNSLGAGEKLIADYPVCEQVATVLQEMIEDQKLLVGAKLKADADLAKYFQELAAKSEDKPETKSKILFTLASFLYEGDKAKGLELMMSAYDASQVYAPEMIDLYGGALLNAGKVDDSAAVYQKLANDYPVPTGVDPDKAPTVVQTAQAIAIYGQGKALQTQGKVPEAAALFENLKKLYPWSPKLLEADDVIAESLVQQKDLKKATDRLIQIKWPKPSGPTRTS